MFSCPECKKRFSFKTNLERHRNGFHLNRVHSCEFCGKTFKRNETLKNHGISGRCHSKRASNATGAGNCDNWYEDNESFEETNVNNEDGLKDIGSPGKTNCLDEASSSKFLEEGPGSLDITMYSLVTNQVMNPRDKLKCYLKVLGHHLGRKRINCEEDEPGVGANCDASEDKHEENKSGNGAKKDIFEGTLDNDVGEPKRDIFGGVMKCDTSGEESNCEDVDGGSDKSEIFEGTLDDNLNYDVTGQESNCVSGENDDEEEDNVDSIGDGVETEESEYSKEHTLEDDENDVDEDYEKVFINWPKYNVRLPWESYGEKIMLFDQLDCLKYMATSQSTLTLMKQIRHAAEPLIMALCEIALNLIKDRIPMTVEDFDCYKGQKDSLRELASGDNNWRRNRLLLGSNNTLGWILLVSIEPLYDNLKVVNVHNAEEEEPERKQKRKICSPIQTSKWRRYEC